MWRNSAVQIFRARVFSSANNPRSIISSPYSALFSHYRSTNYCSSSLSPSSSSSSIEASQSAAKLVLENNGSDGVGAFESQALGLLFKARNALDLGRRYAHCYSELSKARLSMLVVATSGTGYILGSGNTVDFAGLCWTCAGTMMVAASASSLNQIFEKTNDAKMKRTRLRPLPSGRITVPHAITWASFVGSAGAAALACKANTLAAGLGVFNLILYAFVYTPMKQIHPINTWVGAIVGAIPPLLGWAAAAGQVSPNGMILPAALYFWQIPHFMALAYLCRDDYAAGGYNMLSLTDASGQRTAAAALRNCLYLVPLGFLCYDWGITSGWFCVESTILTLAISATAYSFYRDRTTQKARRMFHASLLYLPVFMSGLLFHRISDEQQHNVEEEVSLESDANSKAKSRKHPQTRPPVAYASVAPFPFLPAPSYAAP